MTNPAQPDLIGGIEEDASDLINRNNDLFLIGKNELTQYELNPEAIEDYVLEAGSTFK